MKRAVYIAGHAVCCASGMTVPAVVDALCAGRVPDGFRSLGERRLPYRSLPIAAVDWTRRAKSALAALHAQLPDCAADVPLWVASSSWQIGRFETQGAAGDVPPGAASLTLDLKDWLGLEGPHFNCANACVSGFSAIEAASTLIAEGQIDEALVLGVELANRSTLAGFAAMQLLTDGVCRPLDARRDGLILGEAVAAVHLSHRPAAWRVAAVRTGLDAWSPTSPNPSGQPIAALAGACLDEAGIKATQLDLIKLQAAGSPATDLAEARAVQHLLAGQSRPLVSLKPGLGHTLGASGVAELSALLACLETGRIPLTPGFAEDDPLVGLRPTEATLEQPVRCALLNLIGFGGGLANLLVVRA